MPTAPSTTVTTAARTPLRHAPEIKRAGLPPKRVGLDGTFEGYACLFGVPDLGQDVIVRGAFQRTLATRGAAGIKLLYQHDPTQLIGVWLEIAEDARGLKVRGRLATEIAKAREAYTLLKIGALDGLSIGFRTVKGSRDPTTGLRRLDEIDLWEISVVTFPMQPDARVTAVKATPATPAARQRHLIARLRRATRNLAAAPTPPP